MKLTMQLTLDGLVRALRLDAHGLAEAIEGGYRRDPDRRETVGLPRRKRTAKGEEDDAGARR